MSRFDFGAMLFMDDSDIIISTLKRQSLINYNKRLAHLQELG